MLSISSNDQYSEFPYVAMFAEINDVVHRSWDSFLDI